MSRRRFLVGSAALDGPEARLDAAEAAHARKVLRLNVGDEVWLVDGHGRRARARLTSLDKSGASCRIEAVERLAPLRPRLVICPGLAKGPAMDFLAARLTELAVDELRPFLAARGEVRLRDEGQRLERWRRLAGQALKQCGAPLLPEFFAPLDLEALLALAPARAARLVLYEREDGRAMAQVLAEAGAPAEVWALIGPEGGFTAAEIDRAAAAGFTPCGLGGVILRAETACLAVAAVARFGAQNFDVAKIGS